MKKLILALISATTIPLTATTVVAQTTPPRCASFQERLNRAQRVYGYAQTRLTSMQTRFDLYRDKGIERTSILTARAEFSEGILKATEEQVTKQGYGCLLQPNPCILSSSLGIREELRRAQLRSTSRRRQLDRWTREYARSVSSQTANIQKQQGRVTETGSAFTAAQRALNDCLQP